MKLAGKILLVLTLLPCWMYAQVYTRLTDPSSCYQAIKSTHQSVSSLSADFRELTDSEMFDKPVSADGKLLFRQKEKVRWEYASPKSLIILISGDDVRMSEHGRELTDQAAKTMVRRIQKLMLSLLSGEFLDSKEFTIAYFQDAQHYKLELTPVKSGRMKYVEKIALVFSKSDLLLREMVISKTPSEKVTFQFRNIKQNVPIEDRKFTQF